MVAVASKATEYFETAFIAFDIIDTVTIKDIVGKRELATVVAIRK